MLGMDSFMDMEDNPPISTSIPLSSGVENTKDMILDFDPLSFKINETTSKSSVTKSECSQTFRVTQEISSLVDLDMFDPLSPEPDQISPKGVNREDLNISSKKDTKFTSSYVDELICQQEFTSFDNSIPSNLLEVSESCQEIKDETPKHFSSNTIETNVFTDLDSSEITTVVQGNIQQTPSKMGLGEELDSQRETELPHFVLDHMEVLSDQNTEQNVTLLSSENNMEIGDRDLEAQHSDVMEEAELARTETGTASSEREKTTDNTEVEESAVESETTEKVESSVNLESLESQPVPENLEVFENQLEEQDTLCKGCGKYVHLTDKIIADKSAFHKSCFNCKECGKSLDPDIYSSHEGDIYCKLHHKQIFQPKLDGEEIFEDDSKKEEATDVQVLDVRHQCESSQEEVHPLSTKDETLIKGSEEIQDRMKRYQSTTSQSHQNEQVLSSEKEEQISGRITNDEIKQSSNLQETIGTERSSSMRAAYEQACKESSSVSPTCSESIGLGLELKAVSIKEKFEKGVLDQESNEKMEKVRREKEEDLSIVSETRDSVAGARTLFKQYDTVNTNVTSLLPGRSSCGETKWPRELMYGGKTTIAKEVVKCSKPGTKEQVDLEPAELQEKFNYFENYKETKPQLKSSLVSDEIPRDPNVVRASDVQEEVMGTDTAKRMLDKFKQLENKSAGLSTQCVSKPISKVSSSQEATKIPEKHRPSTEPQYKPDVVRYTYKVEDDMTWKADQARNLKAKFEHWDNEVERENKIADDEGLPESDTTKNLRAKFEAIRVESSRTIEKPQPRGKKFAELGRAGEECDLCGKKLYPMEKMEASGFKFHRNCFRCSHCNSLLRLDNYTINSRKFYCTPHFKQYFKSKGSYEDGFINNGKKELSEDTSGYTSGNTCDVNQVTNNQKVAV
ncbi:uncharacterized protein LOC143257118 [Tachypleus tridentatus]|uniref:uncharacterized protein LOC143257118 n=1 Tax=Tachypleus tridentatus TaxID=6853 RepID=UPI003FD42493